MQQLAGLYPNIVHVGGVDRAGVVMRVEPEISGAVLVAKDEEMYRILQRHVKHNRVECIGNTRQPVGGPRNEAPRDGSSRAAGGDSFSRSQSSRAARSGRTMRKVAPRPNWLSTSILPP